MSLTDKKIIVTGGSKGIGFATAQELVKQGAKVALLARNQESIDKAIELLGNDKAIGYSVDVSDHPGVLSAFDKIHKELGVIDAVINNAGLAIPNAIEKILPEALNKQIQVNFVGVVYCCQAAIPYLRQSKGRIINISSASVLNNDEMAHMSIYSATKAAVARFTEELREELKADGIGVTLLSPGFAITEFGSAWNEAATIDALRAWAARGPNFNGSMQAADVGKAIAHCLDYPTGVAIDFLEVRPYVPSPKPIL